MKEHANISARTQSSGWDWADDLLKRVTTRPPDRSMILRLSRELGETPPAAHGEGFSIRACRIPDDVSSWLALRDAATKDLRPMPGPWSEADFFREFTGRKAFRSEWMWVAEPTDMTETCQPDAKNLSGSVTAIVGGPTAIVSARVHWLLVHPHQRRKGVATALMLQLERACWDAGIRRISLETHGNWLAAVAFYRRLGYA